MIAPAEAVEVVKEVVVEGAPATNAPPPLAFDVVVVLALVAAAKPFELLITPVQAAFTGQHATCPAWSRAQFVPELQQAPPAFSAVQAL